MSQQWTKDELKELDRYRRTNITELTLFKRIYKLNPDRTYEAVMRKLRRLRHTRDKDKAVKSLRVGYLDIETTDLRADWGFMLTWYIKRAGKNKFDFGIITKDEIADYRFDRRITEELLDALQGYDRIYTHWGADRRFDLPFIRTRALKHGLGDRLPKYMEQFIFDTWPIARNKLRLGSNRLDNIAETLGIKGVRKTRLSPEMWQLARHGHPESLEYIALHNKRDVQLLERVHKKLECVERPIYRSI